MSAARLRVQELRQRRTYLGASRPAERTGFLQPRSRADFQDGASRLRDAREVNDRFDSLTERAWRMKSGNAVLLPGCICHAGGPVWSGDRPVNMDSSSAGAAPAPAWLGEDNATLLIANWMERWREPSTDPHSPEGRRATDPDWLS